MKRMPIIISALVAAVLAAACDPNEETCASVASADGAELATAPDIRLAGPAIGPEADDDVAFREMGPPELWVITKWKGAPIKTAEFVSAVISCLDVADPTWTCSLSFYAPDTTKPDVVGGLGCSAMWSPKFKGCLLTKWQDSGAVKY